MDEKGCIFETIENEVTEYQSKVDFRAEQFPRNKERYCTAIKEVNSSHQEDRQVLNCVQQ